MRKGILLGSALLVLAIGFGLATMSGDDGTEPSTIPDGSVVPGAVGSIAGTLAPSSTTVTTLGSGMSATSTVSDPKSTTYLVWTSGGLTDGLVTGLERRFDIVSIVAGDAAPLDIGDGQVVPLDAVAIDVDSHAPFDPAGETRSLRPGTVLLGETSAAYRGLAVGDRMTFGEETFEVAAIVSDEAFGAAEVVFSVSDPGSPVTAARYALVETDVDRSELEPAVAAMNDSPAPARIRAEGETRWMRHADAVLPQIFIKAALGEFSYPADSGPELTQDRDFVNSNIVTTEVPVLGRVTCHRVVVEMLIGAMDQLEAEGLSDAIDPGEFAGCWNPRFIRTITGTPTGVSRHSWGAALDINAASNGLGTRGSQDRRLVEIMKEWGFLWGGDWAVPDPMHFEYGVLPDS
ncbi:MAG: M15 family metallopeptidase [Acidimicrobiia bacterium]